MAYKFDKPREGESLSDYLVRHKAHPKLTPMNERLKRTDEEMKADGSLLPDDHPVYTEGAAISLTFGGGSESVARYYLTGDPPGTNLLKHEDGLMYYLDDKNNWQCDSGLIGLITQEPDTHEVTLAEAQEIYARLTSGLPWKP